MELSSTIRVSVDARICKDGYEIVRIPAEGILRGLADTDGKVTMVVAKDGKEIESKRLTGVVLERAWNRLVMLHNVKRSSSESRYHRSVIEFVNRYGLFGSMLPYSGGFFDETNLDGDLDDVQLQMPLRLLEGEVDEMVEAIEKRTDEFVEPTKGILGELLRDRTMTLTKDLAVEFSTGNILLAMWFALSRTPLPAYRSCGWCGGPNLARQKSRFCSSHCRSHSHKAQSKSVDP